MSQVKKNDSFYDNSLRQVIKQINRILLEPEN